MIGWRYPADVRHTSFLLVSIAVCGWSPSGAMAQDGKDDTTSPGAKGTSDVAGDGLEKLSADKYLEIAEGAYQNVEVEVFTRYARAAINEGGLSQRQTARAYELLAMGLSFSDRPDEAKYAFIKALAINPRLELNESLGPKLQGPFLEAKGFWAGIGRSLSVSTTLTEGSLGLSLRLQIDDPSGMVTKYHVSIRRPPTEGLQVEEYKVLKGEAQSNTQISVENLWGKLEEEQWHAIRYFEIVVRILDKYGNEVQSDGDRLNPVRVDNPRFEEPTALESLATSPWFWSAAGVVAVGAGVLIYAYAIAPAERTGTFKAVGIGQD